MAGILKIALSDVFVKRVGLPPDGHQQQIHYCCFAIWQIFLPNPTYMLIRFYLCYISITLNGMYGGQKTQAQAFCPTCRA